ncbi:MAG: TolC family protein [Rhodospirillales bacterium]
MARPRFSNLTAQQPIYNFYNGPRIRQAEQTTKSQRARLVGIEQDVLLRTAAVYLDVVRAEALLRFGIDYDAPCRAAWTPAGGSSTWEQFAIRRLPKRSRNIWRQRRSASSWKRRWQRRAATTRR